MTELKRPLKVFLSHAHSDARVVHALYDRLIADGVDAWLDKEKLIGGQDWEYEIRKAVRESDVVIICLSKQFAQKGFRQYEVRIALEEANLQPEGEIFIVPLRLEECNVPQNLSRWHWVDLFESDGYKRLIRSLQERADNIGAYLQVKKRWLPKITLSGQKVKKQAASKESVPIDEVETKTPQDQAKEVRKFTKSDSKSNKGIIFPLLGIAIILLAMFFGLPYMKKWFSPPPPVENQPQMIASSTFGLSLTTTPTYQPTSTKTPDVLHTIQPAKLYAVIQATEGDGAFVREKPNGPVRFTLENGTLVELLDEPHEVDAVGIVWVKVAVTRNNVRTEGWILHRATVLLPTPTVYP